MSIRTTLSESNMDLVMRLVRDLDKNPSEVINRLLSDPEFLISARSKLDEEKECKNRRKY